MQNINEQSAEHEKDPNIGTAAQTAGDFECPEERQFSQAKSFLEMLADDSTDEEAEIGRMFYSNKRINTLLSEDISLKEDADVNLRSEYEKAHSGYSSMMSYASVIDHIDMFLGPIQTGLRMAGNEFAYSLYAGSKIVELAAKGVFALAYMRKTDEKNTVMAWIGNEAAAAALPYGNIINMYPLYKTLVKSRIRKEAENSFLEKIGEYREAEQSGKVISYRKAGTSGEIDYKSGPKQEAGKDAQRI